MPQGLCNGRSTILKTQRCLNFKSLWSHSAGSSAKSITDQIVKFDLQAEPLPSMIRKTHHAHFWPSTMRFPSTVPVLGLSSFAWVGAACNADDCSRPLQGNAAAASSYCSTYTKAIATATTGFPSYIPTTYGPSRVSSVCTCLASSTSGPTTTAQPACSTGQVVLKPSFYGLPPFMQLISSLGPSIIMAAPLGACLIHIAITR